jgi:hypothetical protein
MKAPTRPSYATHARGTGLAVLPPDGPDTRDDGQSYATLVRKTACLTPVRSCRLSMALKELHASRRVTLRACSRGVGARSPRPEGMRTAAQELGARDDGTMKNRYLGDVKSIAISKPPGQGAAGVSTAPFGWIAETGGGVGAPTCPVKSSDPSAATPAGGSVGKGRAAGGDKPRSLSGGELQLLLGRRACG